MSKPSTADHLVFRRRGAPALLEQSALAGYRFELWEPSILRVLPRQVPKLTYGAWWLFDRSHVFRNGAYGLVLVWRGGELAHRLGIFPGWFRFPFMGRTDLQFGDLWTAPEHRGRGLAAHAVAFAARARGAAFERTFWYLTHESNSASIRTAERCGFTRVARAVRTRRMGLRQFGSFELAQL